ncbi:peroxiredoxin [Novosphingobium sp. M1R2S20]|uniref:thioredoxin-dependent peroxiredoxin n=1 Tax=Novosphingobium rhizovicinum TaxID=3228928 RepID=A0ABV3R8W1_9SPHN
MRTILIAFTAFAALALPGVANADLPIGAKAPAFKASAALAGKDFTFDLRTALRKGPVVLYFYPKAFTQGCTLEAHAFAEAAPQFAKHGASVVGMSADDLPTLRKFSTEACRDKFAVGVATPSLIEAYDVALKRPGMASEMTDRTSYVIAPDGRIAFVHSDLDYRDHVRLTLEAVKALKSGKR